MWWLDTKNNYLCLNNFCCYSFASSAWIDTLVIGAGRRWEVRVKGNLTPREDTGMINTSPITAMLPIVRLQHGCDHTIEIPGMSTVNIQLMILTYKKLTY